MKYAKYSTEQLEVILTHLADPEEKELVKKELSRRYYNHYLGLINAPEDNPQTLTTPEAEAVPAGRDMPATGAPSVEDLASEEELEGIAEVAPPQLTPPPQETAVAPEEKPSDKTAKKFCFIATAAYGTPLAPEVMVLQSFRDDYLAAHVLGKKFILAYYRFSRPLANRISNQPALKLLAGWLLTPIVSLIKKTCGYSDRF